MKPMFQETGDQTLRLLRRRGAMSIAMLVGCTGRSDGHIREVTKNLVRRGLIRKFYKPNEGQSRVRVWYEIKETS